MKTDFEFHKTYTLNFNPIRVGLWVIVAIVVVVAIAHTKVSYHKTVNDYSFTLRCGNTK